MKKESPTSSKTESVEYANPTEFKIALNKVGNLQYKTNQLDGSYDCLDDENCNL